MPQDRTRREKLLYDADDEAALLGAALINQQAALLVATHTSPADFHVPLHGRVSTSVRMVVVKGAVAPHLPAAAAPGRPSQGPLPSLSFSSKRPRPGVRPRRGGLRRPR